MKLLIFFLSILMLLSLVYLRVLDESSLYGFDWFKLILSISSS